MILYTRQCADDALQEISNFEQAAFSVDDVAMLVRWTGGTVDGFVELVVGVGNTGENALARAEVIEASDDGGDRSESASGAPSKGSDSSGLTKRRAFRAARRIMKVLKRKHQTLSDFYRSCGNVGIRGDNTNNVSDAVRERKFRRALDDAGVSIPHKGITENFICTVFNFHLYRITENFTILML